jgi:hypothetical protein
MNYESISKEIKMINHLMPDEVGVLKLYFRQIAKKFTPEDDIGTCVLGNCIKATVLPKRHRYSVQVPVFNNLWTQTEQPKILKEMIKLAKQKFPEWEHLITYEPGNMD